MITHNELTAGLWLVVAVSSGTVGALLAWTKIRRQLDECCDCCTCRDCEPDLIPVKLGRGIGGSFDEHGAIIDRWHRDGPDQPKIYDYRRTVVLEPGPTIYPELRALADQALGDPESHVAASDSTWLYKILLDWENRYPIPLDSPNGRMAEAT